MGLEFCHSGSISSVVNHSLVSLLTVSSFIGSLHIMSANWLYQAQGTDNLLETIIEFESRWQTQYDVEQILAEVATIKAELQSVIEPELSGLDNLYLILDHLYDAMCFTGPGLQYHSEADLAQLSHTIMTRTGNQLVLSTLFSVLFRDLGFNAQLADYEDTLTLAVKLSGAEIVMVDPVSAGSEYLISSDDMQDSLVSNMAAAFVSIDDDEWIKMVLTEQKVALIEEDRFDQALHCVEVLMELLPDDPYERRDRGLVLDNLDCRQWAKEDYDYFIKACPNDPVALFLRLQLEEQNPIVTTIH